MTHLASSLKEVFPVKKFGVLFSPDTVDKALSLMSQRMISSVIIINDENRPLGIFTERDALKNIADGVSKNALLSEVMTTSLFTVDENTSLYDGCILLQNKGFRHLVVIDSQERFVNVVSEGDFLRYLEVSHFANAQNIDNVMIKTPLLLQDKNISIKDAAKLMSDQGADYAVVTDNYKPIGIVHERTMAHYIIQLNNSPNDSIEPLMSDKIISVDKTISLQESANMLAMHGVHQLIVTDDAKNVIGLLKRSDVLRAAYGSYFDFLLKKIEEKDQNLKKLIAKKDNLTEKANFLNLVINTFPDLLWIKDEEGFYLQCNKAFETVFEVNQSFIIGKTNYDFMQKDEADIFKELDYCTIASKSYARKEVCITFKNSLNKGLFEVIQTVLTDDAGKTLCVLGVARDITEIKLTNENLIKLNNELVLKSRMAQMGEMISIIAHQWKKPLTIICAKAGALQMQRENELTYETKDVDNFFDTFNAQIDFLNETLNEFRDFYNPNKQVLAINLADLIERALSLVSHEISIENIEIIRDISESAKITTNANEFIQVALNLIKNIKDEFIKRPILRKVMILRAYESDLNLYIDVIDNAGGIPSDILHKIFTPFFTTKDKDGTGLGLSICKTIIEKNLGGKIEASNIDTEYGRGAMFRIILPISSTGYF